jgi:ELP3 family radical SAM enzyme/protein acetyltransferase
MCTIQDTTLLNITSDIEGASNSTKSNEFIVKSMLKELCNSNTSFESFDDIKKCLLPLQRKYKFVPNKYALGKLYRNMIKENPNFAVNQSLYNVLITKGVRSESGILNISVSLPPDKFSCKYNCHFCPNEPGMPRSYLSNEDVFQRAAKFNFDTIKQVHSRLDVLKENGHPIDKLEFRVLGGTFSCYDHSITDTFVRDLYYAANTYFNDASGREREPETIEEEQAINVTTKAHVVGLGIETRPDEIDESEIIRFRRYGVTRVELGVQHTDDNLLRKVNRGHGIKQSKRAIKLLKDYGFKLELHIMADLPGATPEGDKDCYRLVLRDDPDLIPDYMKDYPCLDVTFTKVREWKQQGKWTPYSDATPDARDLKDVLIYRQSITPKWVRVNRIQRDFKPDDEKHGFLGFKSTTVASNLAQIVKDEAEKQGVYCQCIRCCEVRNEKFTPDEVTYKVVSFTASGAPEYFISAEVDRPNRNLMLGFLRLRISDALENSIIPELQGKTAMIRELHVYGKIQEVGVSAGNGDKSAQHLGIGKKLLGIAESISVKHGMSQIAIISGIGVRGYYQKNGYELRGSYMMKSFPPNDNTTFALILLLSLGVMLFSISIMHFLPSPSY